MQNPGDKREIICDTQLSRIMGGQGKVTMFSMNKFITAHLVANECPTDSCVDEDATNEEANATTINSKEITRFIVVEFFL